LHKRQIFNPADEIFLRLARVFPVDFVILSVLVMYIFCASMFGIIGLGIRFLCFNMYALRPRKSLPQALLVLCNVVSHILLALCMALLTIAPNYTSFGSQMVTMKDGSPSWCSLERQEARAACQISVISAFFTRIAIAMPLFSVAYYFANWAFIGVYASVFVHCLLCQKKQAFLDPSQELEEEQLGLLVNYE